MGAISSMEPGNIVKQYSFDLIQISVALLCVFALCCIMTLSTIEYEMYSSNCNICIIY